MKKTIAAIIFAVPSIALGQAGIDVQTENLVRIGSEVRANFSVSNGTGGPIKMVFVECTFFDADKKPFNTQTGIVKNVKAGEKAYGKATALDPDEIKSASCRFSQMAQ